MKLWLTNRNYYLIISILLILVSPIIAYSQNNGYATTKITQYTTAQDQIMTSYGLAILAVLVVMFSCAAILKRCKPSSFFDIIRDATWYPSLPRFQFLIWTCIILFVFFAIYSIRILNNVLEPISSMPENLLILMGISIISPIAGKAISSVKYGNDSSSARPEKKDMVDKKFYTMLNEGKKPSLSRVQMFSWTWIAVAIYLMTFFTYVGGVATEYVSHKVECDQIYSTLVNNGTATPKQFNCMHDLTIPNVDETFVVLMGLSQGAYLGGKFVSQSKPNISIVGVTKKANSDDYDVFILGNNFGQMGVVKIDKNIVNVDEANWSEEKITLTLSKNQLPGEGKTKFSVISKGVSSDVYDNSS